MSTHIICDIYGSDLRKDVIAMQRRKETNIVSLLPNQSQHLSQSRAHQSRETKKKQRLVALSYTVTAAQPTCVITYWNDSNTSLNPEERSKKIWSPCHSRPLCLTSDRDPVESPSTHFLPFHCNALCCRLHHALHGTWMYNAQCTLLIKNCTLYIVHSALCTVRCTLHWLVNSASRFSAAS